MLSRVASQLKIKLNPTETRNLEANKKRMQRERKLLVDAQGTRSHEATEKRKQMQKMLVMTPKKQGRRKQLKPEIKGKENY